MLVKAELSREKVRHRKLVRRRSRDGKGAKVDLTFPRNSRHSVEGYTQRIHQETEGRYGRGGRGTRTRTARIATRRAEEGGVPDLRGRDARVDMAGICSHLRLSCCLNQRATWNETDESAGGEGRLDGCRN